MLVAADAVAHDAVTAALAGAGAGAAVADAFAGAETKLGLELQQFAVHLLDRALGDPRLAGLQPESALHAQASILGALSGAEGVSVWGPHESPGVLSCIAASGRDRHPRRVVTAAGIAVAEGVVAKLGVRAPVIAAPVAYDGTVHAAVVVRFARAPRFEDAEELAVAAAHRVAPVLERARLLRESEQRSVSIVAAAERRLARVAYDLHDGPVQDALVLAEELRLFADDVDPLVGDRFRESVREGLGSVRAKVARLAEDLRELAQSLETSTVSRLPLEQLLEREAGVFRERSAIDCALDVRADLLALTDSQRITLFRIAQESLANVAEHSGASSVVVRLTESSSAISLTVTDDGRGFDAAARMREAATSGRLGLVGMAERVRLLGGVFRVTSAPGRGTTVRAVLARWRPSG